MQTLTQKLGLKIKLLRKQKGITQEQLAEMINLDVPNLSNIERGKRFMTAKTLEKISLALKVTERELFDFSETEPENYLKSDIYYHLKNFNNDELSFILNIIKTYKELRK